MDQNLVELIGVVSGVLTIVLAVASAGAATWRHWRRLRRRLTEPPIGELDAGPVVRSAPRPAAAELFDRDTELEECTRLLSSGARLVTIAGPGGIGKTTLAEMAVRTGRFRDYREARLAGLNEDALLPAWVAQQLG